MAEQSESEPQRQLHVVSLRRFADYQSPQPWSELSSRAISKQWAAGTRHRYRQLHPGPPPYIQRHAGSANAKFLEQYAASCRVRLVAVDDLPGAVWFSFEHHRGHGRGLKWIQWNATSESNIGQPVR